MKKTSRIEYEETADGEKLYIRQYEDDGIEEVCTDCILMNRDIAIQLSKEILEMLDVQV